MSTKILIVEDEIDIREGISEYLSEVGYDVMVAEDGQEGIDLFKSNEFDLVLLDIMLPKINGFGVLSQIREISDVPVMMLTAMTDDYSQIMSFNEKADDYITKPFSPKEVALRIKINLKKNVIMNNAKKEDSVLEFGPFKIDQQKFEVMKNGRLIYLKPKEYKMFLYMAKNINYIISKEQFCDKVWGEDFEGFDNTIMVHIRKLREKLEDNPSKPKYIINVKGLGYKLSVKDE